MAEHSKRLNIDKALKAALSRFPARRIYSNTSDAVVASRTVALNEFLQDMIRFAAKYPEVSVSTLRTLRVPVCVYVCVCALVSTQVQEGWGLVSAPCVGTTLAITPESSLG